MTYYFIDDFDNICRQKDGMDKDFAEVIDLIELINNINKIQEENEELRQAYTQLKHRHNLLHDVCIDAECDRDSYRKDIASLEKENEQLKKDNEWLLQCVKNQSVIINELDSVIMAYNMDHKIIIKLTEKDLKTLDKALSYYTHQR